MADCMGENECFSGGLVTCTSGSFDWYKQAETDFDAWLHTAGDCMDLSSNADSCDIASSSSHDLSTELVIPLEDLVPARIVLKGRRCGQRTYLVEWQAADGLCTWETETDLENYGHSPLIETFHASRRVTPTVAPPVRTGTCLPQRTFDPSRYWPDFMLRLQKAFGDCGLSVKNVYNVCHESRAMDFSKRMASLSDAVPVLLFHGTRSVYIRSIITEGLRVPHTGPSPVPVRNGSRFGVGIYTATEPSTSRYYSDGLMFVCAGLVGNSFFTPEKARNVGGGVCVFEDASLVLPCFLVRYEWPAASTGNAVYHSRLLSHVLDDELNATLTPTVKKNEASKEMKAFRQRHAEYAGVRHTREEQLEVRADLRIARKAPHGQKRRDASSDNEDEEERARPTADPYYRCQGPFPLNQPKKRVPKGEKSRGKLAWMKARQTRF